MDIRDFEILVALEAHRHFARAASACGISQPAFSARIQKLEQELGVPIVQRGARFEGFTREGEAVLGWGRRILNDTRGLRQDLGQMRAALAGRITIGVVPSALGFVGRLTADLVGSHRAVQVSVVSLTSIEIQRRIDAITLDAGLTYLDNEPLQRVRAMPLYRERYRLVAADGLLPAQSRGMTWLQASQLPLALLGVDMQYRRIVDALFEKSGVCVSPSLTSSSFTALLGHVRGGRAATIMPEALVEAADMRGLCAVPLIEPEKTHVLGLVVPEREPLLPVTEALWRSGKRHAEAFP
jgi:DNA-binding transcriptional LysR family regulator